VTATESGWRSRAGTTFRPSKAESAGDALVVAANHPLATAAGVETFTRGGNAVDAAIATAFALTVVEPMMVSIFGAGMILVRDGASGEIVDVDDYAVSPAAAHPTLYTPLDGEDRFATAGRANRVGHLAVGVPGALQSWADLLATRGRLGLGEVLAPAIRYAAEGFTVSPYLALALRSSAPDLARFPGSAAALLPDGAPPPAGARLRRRDYARTLETIAADGPACFTHGALAAAVAADMAANGGLITVDDLAAYRWRERPAVRGTYRGFEIVSAAPTSSGGACIVQALNLLEGFDVAALGFGTAAGIHLLAETLKIVFADRAAYMGDPDVVDVPLAWLTDKGYAGQRRGEIDLARPGRPVAGRRPGGAPAGAGAPRAPESANTTHLTVMDGEGTVVAMTQTLNELFGSKVTVPGTGMLLNNCMALFDPRPGRPNSVGARKRMLSSMSPTILLRDGQPWLALGTPGGVRIFGAVLQAIVNVVDHGMTPQEAVDAPRMWTDGGALEVEEGVPAAVRERLAGLGHEVRVVARIAGGMNGVLRDPAGGLLRGAACWRADGTTAGLSGGYTRRVALPAGFAEPAPPAAGPDGLTPPATPPTRSART
jgi:gamma-glutamyltranspeptidase/glutathione hydrolase